MDEIIIINTCRHDMHYFEFVKPIEEVVRKCKFKFRTIPCKDIPIQKNKKIIICGTSLLDFDYLGRDFADKILNPKNGNKVLGICAGMQIICSYFGCRMIKNKEIGLKSAVFDDFLGLKGKRDIYCLHNFAVKDDAAFRKNFRVVSKTACIQAAIHKNLPYYCMMFHPETRNRDIIENFLYRV